MTADEAATRLEEMLACQQGPIVHHCHDHHRAVELGEHVDAVLLELERLRHHVKSVEAELRWTRALVRRLWRDGVEEPHGRGLVLRDPPVPVPNIITIDATRSGMK